MQEWSYIYTGNTSPQNVSLIPIAAHLRRKMVDFRNPAVIEEDFRERTSWTRASREFIELFLGSGIGKALALHRWNSHVSPYSPSQRPLSSLCPAYSHPPFEFLFQLGILHHSRL